MKSISTYPDPQVAVVSEAPIRPRTHFHSAVRRTRGAFAQTIHLLLIIAVAVIGATSGSAQSYIPTDIIPPNGGVFRADAMNDSGQVVGSYTPPAGFERPAVWQNGAMTILPLLPGAVSGWARGLNNNGQFVGACSRSVSDGTVLPQACIWENGTVRALASVDGTNESAAWAINDAGTIIGHIYTPMNIVGNPWMKHRQAVVWQGNSAGKLVPPSAGAHTWAYAIDNFGRVAVSWSSDAAQGDGTWRAARWTPDMSNGTTGTMITLSYGIAYDINNEGVVAAGEVPYWGAALFNGSNLIGLGGHTARSVNETGTAVGYSLVDEATTVALVWDAQNGMRDLNAVLSTTTAQSYPGSLRGGLEINSSGQILASTVQGFCVLTPSSQAPGPERPAAPSAISSDASDTAVQIYWNSVYYASGYNVKRATVSGGPYITIARNVMETAFLDRSVVNGTRYYYVVSSVNGSYESTDSPETMAQPSALPPPPPVPNAPTNLTVGLAKNAKSVNVAWKQPTNTEIYRNRVYRSTNGGVSYSQLALINPGTNYLDTNVSRGVNYTYAVTALNSNGQESALSNTVTVRLK
jgi:uncharacterized membrane protein